MSEWLAPLLMAALLVAGAAISVSWWRDSSMPFPARPHPSYIFRLVKRDERAVYARIMRRTLAVHMRDMSRAMRRFGMTIAKSVTPAVERLAAALETMFGSRP